MVFTDSCNGLMNNKLYSTSIQYLIGFEGYLENMRNFSHLFRLEFKCDDIYDPKDRMQAGCSIRCML